MKFQVVLYESDEGFAVCAPSLPGCWSQGVTRNEAVENISIAIREYLESEDVQPNDGTSVVASGPGGSPQVAEGAELREVEIAD